MAIGNNEPMRPIKNPSKRKGALMKLFLAPTLRMIQISFFLEAIEILIVL